MDERGANIDLCFRNGLKDFEVLPPPEVWESIKPAIRVKRGPFILLRTAAMVAVLLTLSFLAYRWSRDNSTLPDNRNMALNVNSVSPVISPAENAPVFPWEKKKIPINSSQKSLVAGIPESLLLPESENGSTPDVVNITETNILSLDRTYYKQEPLQAFMNNPQKKSFESTYIVPRYLAESIPEKSDERWSIGAMASPTYYSNITSGNSDLSKQLASSEKSLLSYSGGVAISYNLNKRFSIQTGLYYSSFDQEVDGINSFGGFQKYDYTKGDHNFSVLTTSGTVVTDNADVFLIASGPADRVLTAYTNDVFDPNKANLNYISNTLLQNFSFLELPVILRYKIIDKVIDINLIGGISYNMLINNSAYTMVDGGKYPIGKTEGLNLLTLSSSLGMGLGYNFSNKLSLNLEPTFRYYLNPFQGGTGSTNHPYSFGLFSGISYKF